MKFKRHFDSPLKKKACRGFRGYPVATIAFYGPDDTRASKVAVAIVDAEDADPSALDRLPRKATFEKIRSLVITSSSSCRITLPKQSS